MDSWPKIVVLPPEHGSRRVMTHDGKHLGEVSNRVELFELLQYAGWGRAEFPPDALELIEWRGGGPGRWPAAPEDPGGPEGQGRASPDDQAG
jgi:hypothetical protein